jgi:hypothetical protein
LRENRNYRKLKLARIAWPNGANRKLGRAFHAGNSLQPIGNHNWK